MSLTAEGFERKRLAEIKSDYDALLTESLGPINTNADSVVGQLEGAWAEGIDNAQEALQDTYDSMYPSTAEGTSLDGAVSFVGLSRISSAPTVVTAAAYGVEGTVVPAGSIAHSDITYTSTHSATISASNALDVYIEVSTLSSAVSYNVFAGGVSSTYTSDADATKAEIIAGLAADIASDDLLAVASGETLRITAADGESPFAIGIDAKLVFTKISSPIVFVASTNGAKFCPIGALINIDTPITGWDSLYNLIAGVTGRDTETDTELRARHANGVRIAGAATVEAIKARLLQDVDLVTSVSIYENRTHLIVGAMPPHSFEAIVSGGATQDVADKLWEVKPAGIETYGNTTIQVTDTAGDLQVINFSRPVPKYAWVRVTVNALYSEETLTASVISSIKTAVATYGATLGVGKDIITQRFYGPIYDATHGIGSILVEVALTNLPDDTPVYTTSNVSVARAEIATFNEARVFVAGV